jgi:hypothetical protein
MFFKKLKLKNNNNRQSDFHLVKTNVNAKRYENEQNKKL